LFVIGVTWGRFPTQDSRETRETILWSGRRGTPVERALRNQNVWLTVGYVCLILLLSRTYS
jgi:hypothetical protein